MRISNVEFRKRQDETKNGLLPRPLFLATKTRRVPGAHTSQMDLRPTSTNATLKEAGNRRTEQQQRYDSTILVWVSVAKLTNSIDQVRIRPSLSLPLTSSCLLTCLVHYSTMATNSNTNNSLCVTLGSARNTFDLTVKVAAADTLSAARTEHQQKQNLPLDSLQIVVSASELSKVYSPMDLSAWMNVLKPKAAVSVQVLFDDDTNYNDNKKVLQTVHTSFLLAGLVGTLERKGSDGSRVLEASKKYSDQEATGLRAAPIRVSIQLNDDDDDDMMDDDVIDEDNLLADTSNLLAPPPSMSAAAAKAGDDCGGRKACDDCSCGRAEAENGKAQAPTQPIKSSSCGKCNLGDAFRCASCPYLGKPAFKAGEEHLVLDLQDDF
jgi:hypothetical protein